MQTFVLSSNIKRKKAKHFFKSYMQKKGQKNSLDAFTRARLFSRLFIFLVELFAIFSTVLHSVYNSACFNTHFEFFL